MLASTAKSKPSTAMASVILWTNYYGYPDKSSEDKKRDYKYEIELNLGAGIHDCWIMYSAVFLWRIFI
jgi:hypothetical protein